MITIDYIQKIVADYFNMPVESLQLKTRKREIVQARQIAMYFSKDLTEASLASIGAQIGQKNHATVLHAHKTVNNLYDTDKKFRTDIDEIEKRIKEGCGDNTAKKTKEQIIKDQERRIEELIRKNAEKNQQIRRMRTRSRNLRNKIKQTA